MSDRWQCSNCDMLIWEWWQCNKRYTLMSELQQHANSDMLTSDQQQHAKRDMLMSHWQQHAILVAAGSLAPSWLCQLWTGFFRPVKQSVKMNLLL